MIQARENLSNFRQYLEGDSIDSQSCFHYVSETMSHAFSQFANRTADLQADIEAAESKLSSLDLPVEEANRQKSELDPIVSQLTQETSTLRDSLAELQQQNAALESEIAQNKQWKRQIKEFRQRESELTQQLADNEVLCRTEAEAIAELEAQLTERRTARDVDSREALQKSEQTIRELTVRAKQAELELKEHPQTKQMRKRAPKTPPDDESPSTFVIRDTVKISEDEIESLNYMVREIRKENDQLAYDRDSAMVDIDCLMQENLGLQQLIRQMAEGHPKG
jgi:DNA repair exonuclease SbcCD ATPase subunit